VAKSDWPTLNLGRAWSNGSTGPIDFLFFFFSLFDRPSSSSLQFRVSFFSVSSSFFFNSQVLLFFLPRFWSFFLSLLLLLFFFLFISQQLPFLLDQPASLSLLAVPFLFLYSSILLFFSSSSSHLPVSFFFLLSSLPRVELFTVAAAREAEVS
jgi:hypothetical protein